MKGMTLIVRNVTKLVAGFIALFGLYIVVTGHLTPGGGFAGGVILMSAAVLIVLAFGAKQPRETSVEGRCHVAEGLGALGFLVVALLGLCVGGFFVNFFPAKGNVHEFLSGGTIMLSNLAIGIKVAAGLTGILLALVIACRLGWLTPKES